ncbi:MAG TPA: sugar-binding protein [Kiritimatiellia bacterium]|nr:sugar-binding protein [Kiritimatiellia bacterium]
MKRSKQLERLGLGMLRTGDMTTGRGMTAGKVLHCSVFAVFAACAAPRGMIRHYTFDEGRDDEVVNHVDIRPGYRSRTGGFLGSLEIVHNTAYGMESSESYTAQTNIETRWVEGRVPGTSALRIGTHPVGLYRSGVTGAEFAEGFTIAGWIKFEDSGTGHSHAYPLQLGDIWNGHEGFRLDWIKCGWAKEGMLKFVVGRPRDGEPKKGSIAEITFDTCDTDVWHRFAATLDGTTFRFYLDGVMKEKPFAGTIRHTPFRADWSGQAPFTGGTRVNCLHVGHRRWFDQNLTTPFTFGELAIFGRALSAEEIESFLMKTPAAGTTDEQRIASVTERTARSAADAIVMKIPEDSNGYFRQDAKIPVTVRNAPPGKLKVFVETVFGKPVLEKEVPVGGDGTIDWNFALDICDAYYVHLTLEDESGKTVKGLMRPYPVGIVPSAPDHLNSPFGYWAMEDRFSYDSNLRRVDVPYWGGAIQTNAFLRKHNLFLNVQKIPAEALREFSFIPYGRAGKPAGKDGKFTPEQNAKIREWFGATVDLLAENGVREFEVTSEVDGRTTPEQYVQELAILHEIGRKRIPGIKLYPPGATPCALPFINKILELGAADCVDGVSHHNYLSNPVHSFYWDNPGARLAKIAAAHSKPGHRIEMFNTESGIFSLPRVHHRPMTREFARTALYPISRVGGYETYSTSMPILPETEAAALQIHAILVNLASGYKMYVKCQTPTQSAIPCQQGVALTALSGQILNDMVGIKALPMSSTKTMAVLVDRVHPKTGAKSNVLTVFGMEERTFNFKTTPGAEYRTMDMFGNRGTMKADTNGVLSIAAQMNPVYVFDVPADIAELALLKLNLPAVLPENGVLEGTVEIENRFGVPLAGDLRVEKLRGAEMELSETHLFVKPGERMSVPITVRAVALKRRNYPVRVTFGSLAAETVFASNGVINEVPRKEKPLALDLDAMKWSDVLPLVCDSEDDVVHGKPNFAELWLPQWRNREDLSFAIRTCYVKDDALYFRIDVTDDNVLPAPKEENGLAFQYDCLEFFIDTRSGKSLGAAVDDGADQIIAPALAGPDRAKSDLWYVRREKRHVTVEIFGKQSVNGYVLEGKVVPNKKSAFRLRPGSRFLMDFLVDDCDHPDQKRKAAMAAHGTFDNNSNVSGWGRYELGM